MTDAPGSFADRDKFTVMPAREPSPEHMTFVMELTLDDEPEGTHYINLLCDPRSGEWHGIVRPYDGIKEFYPHHSQPGWKDVDEAIAKAVAMGFYTDDRETLLRRNEVLPKP